MRPLLVSLLLFTGCAATQPAYEPVPARNLSARHDLYAGDDEARLEAFHELAADPTIAAISTCLIALSVVLLGLLMMVTRRNAVSQVIGFMSLENGLVLAATGAKGMPLVVEISVAFSILIAFIVIGIFLFRIRERFDTVDLQALDRFRGERQ